MISTTLPFTNSLSSGVLATLSEKQVDSFLEHLRKQAEESDEAKQQAKKELAEQVQRNADKRKDDLQQTRLQMITESLQSQDRRDRLDAIDDRKILRRQELDGKELANQLDRRLDQKHRDVEKQWDSLQPQADTGSERMEIRPDSPNMLGISQQAATETGKNSPEIKPEMPRNSKPVVNLSHETPQRPVVLTEWNGVVNNSVYGQKAGGEVAKASDTANSNGKVVEPGKTDAVETGKQMQMLASFSDVSQKIASVFKQPVGNSGGPNWPKGNFRPGFAELKESSSSDPSEESVPLDSSMLEKRPRKASPELLANLDAALVSKSRRRSEPRENVKDDPHIQSQQAGSQQGSSTQKTNEKDRPMLRQMDRVRLVQRVANACLSASNQNGTIRIKLHPESLGSVSVKIKTKNKTMNIDLEAETESARAALLENADELKRQLRSQGMQVESFHVRLANP